MKREINFKIQFTDRVVYSSILFILVIILSSSVYALTLRYGPTIDEFSTDTTLSGNSDTAVPTEKAVKTYVDLHSNGSGSSFECPTGFTLVESQGYVLGCIQNDEEGSATIYNAMNECFTNYGGRLPEVSEWFLGLNNSDLSNEIDDYEWTCDMRYGDSNGASFFNRCGSGSLISCYSTSGNTNTAYRCFIPN